MTGHGAAGARTVLGLCAFTHDSAAALIHEGRLVGFVEEERLSGEKHTRAYPEQAVRWLLAEAGLRPEDVATVAYNFAGSRHLAALPTSLPYLLPAATRGRALPRARSFATVYGNYRRRLAMLHERFPAAAVRPVLHHRAHGMYAFAAAGLDHAAVLVVDSLGETQTTTIAAGRRHQSGVSYRIYARLQDPASLGYAYGAVTEHLGWRRGDEEGTVMALAALGDPARFRPLFAEAIRLTRDGFALDPAWFPLRVLDRRYPRTTAAFAAAACPPRRPEENVDGVHADVAAALQERIEQVMLHLARRAAAVTGAEALCLGGGVAMNCVAVGRIAESGLFDVVTVPPAPGDSGTALGAALAAGQPTTVPDGVAEACYLGPDADPGIDQTVAALPAGLAAARQNRPVERLADALIAGAIVGVCRGRLEAGPRALGNRSILASPLTPGIVDRLNATVKYRERFRPFAPVVSARHAAEWFDLTQPSPYMSIAARATDLAIRRIPAVVHANGTARVQTVTAAQNRFLADLLDAVAARTGIPVLINTSLNVKGKPICGTPEMAVDCLLETGLDALLLGDWWVSKQ